jgi:hypothetical protein
MLFVALDVDQLTIFDSKPQAAAYWMVAWG